MPDYDPEKNAEMLIGQIESDLLEQARVAAQGILSITSLTIDLEAGNVELKTEALTGVDSNLADQVAADIGNGLSNFFDENFGVQAFPEFEKNT